MNILLSNDDGFHAEGIQTLASHLRTLPMLLLLLLIAIEVPLHPLSHWLNRCVRDN